MRCLVCNVEAPNKVLGVAETWDWFTGYLEETVYFCPKHKTSAKRDELFRMSQIPRAAAQEKPQGGASRDL